MCSEIDSFSSFLRRNMSDSNNPRFIPVQNEEDKEEITQPAVKSTDSSAEIPPEIKTASSSRAEEKAEAITNAEEETDKATVSSRESREKQIIAEDDDGFKTPTSSEHKIPPITECPPAPKKARPPPSALKRKSSSSPPQVRRSVEMDSPTEVESIFRPMSSKDNAEDDQQKSKKARKEDDGGDRS